jgi:hypothetical protein
MKTVLLSSILLLFFSSIFGQVRQWYDQASSNEDMAEKLISYTDAHLKENPVFAGYNGAARMVMAKHKFNPMSKWETFSKGKKILENAIAKNPDNVELIFLRLTIQENIPAFLGYSDQISADRLFLKNMLQQMADKDLQTRISRYLNPGKS